MVNVCNDLMLVAKGDTFTYDLEDSWHAFVFD